MPASPRRRIRFFPTFFTLSLMALAPLAARADLVWEPSTGWRADGGLAETFFATPEGQNGKELLDAARRAEDAGNTRKALKGYLRVVKKYPASVLAPEALLRSSALYEQTGRYTKAQRQLQRIVAEHPSFERFNEVLGAQYRLADRLAKGARPRYFGVIPGFKQKDKGLEIYEQVVNNAPYSEYAPISLMNASQGYVDAGNRDAAIDALDRMINNYPDSFLTPDAYLRLAGAQASITQGPAYDQASTQLALTYFQDYLILYPGSEDSSVATGGFDTARTMLAESKMTMGDFYYKKRSNYKAAKVFYNEAVTLYPDSPTAERARRYLASIEKIETGELADPNGPRPAPRGKRFWLF
jgi:outer membrane protein assembly factor BamD